MSDRFKVGGIAALGAAATFVVAMILMVAVVAPAGYGSLDVDPVQNVAFLADNSTIMYVWNLVGYVVFGVLLVVLALALHQRLRTGSPAMMQTATALALIWAGLMFASGMVANIGAGVLTDVYSRDAAQAGSAWLALHFVVDGLGGGNEIVGGLWVLLLSWAALRAGALPKALNYLGIVCGVAGLVTVIPPLGQVGAVFGLGLIVWFVWLGIVMLRGSPGATG
jgi:hypothetical protein